MKCKPILREVRSDGRFVYGCQRVGCKNWIGPTPDGLARVHPGACSAWPEWHELGEWLAILLAAVWVTPELATWLQRKLGLIEPGGTCTCNRYKEWLNTFGGRLATSTHWLARW